jgi:adenine-specific DNA methylase
MPVWSQELAEAIPDAHQLRTSKDYHAWFLGLCGILGDAVAAKKAQEAAIEAGVRIPNPYSYKPAFKNSPSAEDIVLLHNVLCHTWGELPRLMDPTAGGGSIPFEASRYGIPCIANDLNPISAAILEGGVAIPGRLGAALAPDLTSWGRILCERVVARLQRFFPSGPDEKVATYLFARSIMCPRTGKEIPLAPNWWLSRTKGGAAARLVSERHGVQLDACEFEIAFGRDIDFDPSVGTMRGGNAVSPWDGLAVSGDYIKAEAKAGRMGSILFAVVIQPPAGGSRTYRAPTKLDFQGLHEAKREFQLLRQRWEASNILPTEAVPQGNDPKLHLWRTHWVDMFTDRQLLVHGTFVEEFQRLVPEVRSALPADSAEAILLLLALMQGKALDYNSRQATWDITRDRISTGGEHAFPFRSTHSEFEGASELYPWCLRQLLDAYISLAGLLCPTKGQLPGSSSGRPGEVTVTEGTAGDLVEVADRSQAVVCIDPPYYDNVWYGELSDFFYVWEKRTLGLLRPQQFTSELTDKASEAVVSEIRFADAGRRKAALAKADYEAKMTAIFSECMRVLRDEGVLTVMFTHKKAEAWDTLGMSLMAAGFTIEASWPVQTEPEQSRHQAKKNSAKTTIMLVCRKREATQGSNPFFEDIEGDVRTAARDALNRFSDMGLTGVDLLLSTYGPALSVISSQWPVYSSEADPATGRSRLLRPEEALDAARGEVVRLRRQRLIGRTAQLDALTDFVLIAWDTFKAAEFPFDEARRLALAVGGLEMDELVKARVLEKKSGTVVLLPPSKRVRRRAEADAALPGVRVDATLFPFTLDAIHTVMHIAAVDGFPAAKAMIDRAGLATDGRFLAALQGLVNAIPRTRIKGEWVRPEAAILDAICTAYLPDISLPGDTSESSEQATLFPST